MIESLVTNIEVTSIEENLSIVSETTEIENLESSNVISLNITQGVFEWVQPPATRNSQGTIGQMSYDDDYFYVCVNTNSWARQYLLKGW